MRMWRLFSIVGMSALLCACSSSRFAPCPFPGAIPAQPTGNRTNLSPYGLEGLNCFYRLTIKELDNSSQEVKATVAKSVIEKDISKKNELLSPTSWFTNYELDEYPFHVYVFRVENQTTFQSLTQGGEYYFESIPTSPLLKLCDDKCLENRKMLINQHYQINADKLKPTVMP